MKVLLVTMYFPPAGGGGVQRSLKLAQYLPALGVETHVLAPDDPKWVHTDSELRVPTQAWVHRARYLGPRARKPAEELAAADGFDRALVQAQVTARRLLLPDASVTWNLTAIPAAIRIVRREGIDVVITTSPPPSVHFVGAAVQKATGARWIADLRDPLVANQHRRDDTTAARARQAAVEQVARLVARQADAVTCVSEAIADEVRGLGARGAVRVISNGCDFDDFAGLEYQPAQRFRITHTGSFFGKRDPKPFLQAFHDANLDAVARFVGDFRSSDREWAATLGLGDRLELVDYLPRTDALRVQRDSEALLLLIPDAGGRGKGVLSGKVYEYIAAGRPILAVVPPDGAAAKLIRETSSGVVVAPDDVEGMRDALVEMHARFVNGGLPSVELAKRDEDRLSRRARVEEMAVLLRDARVDRCVMEHLSSWLEWPDGVVRDGCRLPRCQSTAGRGRRSVPGCAPAGSETRRHAQQRVSRTRTARSPAEMASSPIKPPSTRRAALIPEDESVQGRRRPGLRRRGATLTVPFVASYYRYFLMPRRPGRERARG